MSLLREAHLFSRYCDATKNERQKEKAPRQVAKGLMETSLHSRIFSAEQTESQLCINRTF